MRFLGCDISPSHSGFVLLDGDGELLECRYITDVKKLVALAKKKEFLDFNATAYHIEKKTKKHDLDVFQVKRLLVLYRIFRKIINETEPSHVAIEHFAFSRGTGAYTIGEIAGAMKLIVYHSGIPLRLYRPDDLKMFATGYGNAEKEAVAGWIKDFKKIDFRRFDLGSKDVVSYDLSDAYTVAALLRTESLLRVGKLRLDKLPENVVRIFQRATKKTPVSLLGREWIVKRD